MTDSEMASAPLDADRQAWIRKLRWMSEQQEAAVNAVFDATWGEIYPDHRAFVERFLSLLPVGGRVLDAACGTGKYFGLVLESGRSLLGVDHSAAHLASGARKFPTVPTEKHDLQNLPYRNEFDGVMCVDALEGISPEDWPVVVDRLRRALHPAGWLYLTVELNADDFVRRLNEEARRAGLPVVDGEVISRPDEWVRAARAGRPPEPNVFYHYYPAMQQVRAWISGAGFAIEEKADDQTESYGRITYHHVLARMEG